MDNYTHINETLNSTDEEAVSNFNDVVDYSVLGVTGLFVFLSTAMTFYLMYKHLVNYTRPASQRCIIRIIFMVPLYAVYSYLGLFFYEYQTYFALFRDCYEAYALYMFFVLCIEYAGGWENMEEAFEQQPKRRCLEPLCFVKVKPGANLLRWCQRGILQYALIRPLVTFVSVVLLLTGHYEEGDWSLTQGYVYATIINNIGVTISLYFLVLFYQVGKSELKPYNPLIKFGVIKGIVFFCYWQSVCIMGLQGLGLLPLYRDWNSTRSGVTLQNLLICFEMLIFAILHLYAFPYDMYQIKALSQAPFVREFEISPRGMRGIKRGVKDTINQKDMVKDTIASFAPKKMKQKKKNKFGKIDGSAMSQSNPDSAVQELDTDKTEEQPEHEEIALDDLSIAEDNDKVKNARR